MSVPSFGEWGYVLASPSPFEVPAELALSLRSISPKTLPSLFEFGPDMSPLPSPVNRLDTQVLVRTYESEWKKYD